MSEPIAKECLPFQEAIVQLAFKECPLWKRRAVKSHLRNCPACRAVYAAYLTAAHELQSLPQLAMPASVTDNVWAMTVNRRRSGWLQPVWQWACLSLMVVLTCVALYRYSTRPSLHAYSPDEVLRARTQVQTALGVWGKAMAETRSTVAENLMPLSIDRPVQNSLYIALKPFKTGE